MALHAHTLQEQERWHNAEECRASSRAQQAQQELAATAAAAAAREAGLQEEVTALQQRTADLDVREAIPTPSQQG